MLFSHIAVLTPDGVADDLHVGVIGAKIDVVCKEKPTRDYGEIYDGRGKLLMPGFVNAHSHTPMTLLRGYGENMTLGDWLQKRVFPFEDQMVGDDIYWATMLGIAEMVRYGITSTSDMYFWMDQIAGAFADSGAKANLSRGITCFDDTPYEKLKGTMEARAAIRDWQGAGDGRIRMELSLHSEYTTTEQTARAIAEDALRFACRMHVHVSETLAEHEACKARRKGRTPARYLADCGVFDVPSLAAHCVWAEKEDFAIFAEKGVTVATCPKSNLKLASGVFPVRMAMEAGTACALGTDSVASNNNLNMIEEMRVFLLAQKGFSGDPTLVTPEQAMHAATRAGALAQGRADCGEIREGYRADLIALNIDAPWMHPAHSLMNNVAYAASGSDVCLTMCDGRVLYRDGVFPTIDIERALFETQKSTVRVLGALNR